MYIDKRQIIAGLSYAAAAGVVGCGIGVALAINPVYTAIQLATGVIAHSIFEKIAMSRKDRNEAKAILGSFLAASILTASAVVFFPGISVSSALFCAGVVFPILFGNALVHNYTHSPDE